MKKQFTKVRFRVKMSKCPIWKRQDCNHAERWWLHIWPNQYAAFFRDDHGLWMTPGWYSALPKFGTMEEAVKNYLEHTARYEKYEAPKVLSERKQEFRRIRAKERRFCFEI